MSQKERNWKYYHSPKGREAMSRNQKKWLRKLKIEVLTYYGGGKLACGVCGEARLACLSIDHIEGGGAEWRRKTGRGGTSFYTWLKKQGYPEGYMTLCMNCQWVKRDINKEVRGKEEANGHNYPLRGDY